MFENLEEKNVNEEIILENQDIQNLISSDSKNAIEVSTYLKKFKKNKIGELSFSINSSSITAILGSSGSGKSVLINSIIGALKRYQGEIKVNNVKIKKIKVLLLIKILVFIRKLIFP
ncbi:ATP-binding cassette domain-containing protein [Spiroplasma taiwanense]|uniref:ATP-binding cassette domain-containing protein n=1 Tax=Spiroplasma taiwanense TaxID=2145 RepID=UPI000402364F|nr:ATP-binding cassette domain-containing protein [Spiroplasma taiwanense]